MKRLLVVRHSNAEDRLDSDLARDLTPLGREHASDLAKKILTAAFIPDLVLLSHAKRVLATAEILSTVLNWPPTIQQNSVNLYHGRLYDLLKLIQSLDDAYKNVLIIGHNPTLTEVINYVGDTAIDHLNPSGAALLEFAIESWTEIESAKAKTVLIHNPKEDDREIL